uniref:Crustin 2 n=1 Tax=Panulirus japonicus TaxID=6736 RepID=C7B729_PANJA|nr:crustin 2 [Panulirus japonicus]
MLKLVLLCVLGLALGQQDGNTRLLGQGLGSVVGGLLGGLQGGFHGGGNIHGQSSSCRYWCRTPRGQYYCCESGSRPPGPVGTKPGRCPIVRFDCPPTRFHGGPQTCSNDYSCAGSDKCCYDTCLGEHVCKPSEYPFGGR